MSLKVLVVNAWPMTGREMNYGYLSQSINWLTVGLMTETFNGAMKLTGGTIPTILNLTKVYVVVIKAEAIMPAETGDRKMAITGNYPSGARNPDRGSSAQKWEQAAEMQAAAAKQKAGQVARLQSHLRTLPPQISGFDVNPENGEVTDDLGNYVLTVSSRDTVADVQAEIEAWFECC
jgi:hypothetical protein